MSDTNSPSRQPRDLLRDERGGVYVAALFMATLLVGVFYFHYQLGRDVVARERAQDDADRAAFHGAVTYARALNSIGLTNQSQVVSMATLQTIELVLLNAINCKQANLGVGIWADCDRLYGEFTSARSRAEAQLFATMKAATAAGLAIAAETPDIVTQDLQSWDEAVVFDPRPLPVTPGGYRSVLCGKGMIYPERLQVKYLDPAFFEPGPNGPAFKYRPRAAVNRSPRFCRGAQNVGPLVMTGGRNQSGTEPLQLRALAVQDARSFEGSERAVGAPERFTSGRAVDEENAGPRFAFAQAEYYSEWGRVNRLDSDLPEIIPEENLFYMHWRARMRRFRIADSSIESVSDWIQDAILPACETQLAARGGPVSACSAIGLLADEAAASLH